MKTKILPFLPSYDFKLGYFVFYQRKALITRGVQGVSLLIKETVTHIKDNCRVIAQKRIFNY